MKTDAKPVTIAVFGATGDLAKKKIFPALSALYGEGLLPPGSRVIAVSRREWDDAGFRQFLRDSGSAVSDGFLRVVEYAEVDFEEGRGYAELKDRIVRTKSDVMVYLSLAPRFFPIVMKALRKAGIAKKGRTKFLFEKPFGVDEASACSLNRLLSSFLSQDQIYRVDHYLGKGVVRAIMSMHESTESLRQIISKETVESVTVALLETKGIDDRGASYDGVGAFRDVGQNHILEALAVLMAEYPKKSSAKAWQDARAKVLESLVPPANTCEFSRRGQYRSYMLERGVREGSETETAFEVMTSFSRGELKGIPVALQAGKCMPGARAYLRLVFRDIPGFPRSIEFEIQPEERVIMRSKDGREETIAMPKSRDAYANVILDALSGKTRHFVGSREMQASWRYADRIVACWGKVPLEHYDEERPFFLS
ncbi:MAG: hypothetical protein WC767_03200 [Candidatus Paceibacterota bacterium]